MTLRDLTWYLQSKSEQYMERHGFGKEELAKDELIWVIVQRSFWLEGSIKDDQILSAEIQMGGARHWLFPQTAKIYDEEGRLLATSESRWALMNAVSRQLAEPPKKLQNMAETTEIAEHKNFCAGEPFPKELARKHCLQVQEEDLDENHHVNNAVYLRWCTDLLANTEPGRLLHFYHIEYYKEIPQGTQVHIHYDYGDEAGYFRGYVDGEECFSLIIR